MGVHNISTLEDFETIKKEHRLVVLDAFATWCGPCKAIAPIVVQWSNSDELKGVFFAKFDVEEVPAVAQQLNVRAMPTFIVFKDGERDGEFIGANPTGLQSLILKKVEGLNGPTSAPSASEPAPAAAPTEETKPATDA